MRIIIASISFCEYVIQQANALTDLGHNVLLVLPTQLVNNTVGADMNEFIACGVECYTYEIKRRWERSFYTSLFKTISAFSPEILHIHDNGEIETLALVARFHRLPMVVTVHDVTTHPGADSHHKLRRRLIKQILRRRASVIHLHGDVLREKLATISPTLARKSVIIPHGTLSLFKQWESIPVEREPLTCLFFGRMEKYRGLDNLLKVGRILKEYFPGIKIVVAGRGSELEKYKMEMDTLDIFEIHDAFIPNTDVYRFFRRASLLLLPYHEASQSGVISMSLPFALPVVATSVGSIPEFIADGMQGRLVAPGDIAGFASAVCELLSDTGKLERMRCECMDLAEKLEFNALAKDFDSLYEKAVMVGRPGLAGCVL